ncbi:MAG: TldD/PmbA family protein [Defluviitaleaceae bacterium]|nr:TldD/PmbA family protein [Defluviitaleaceae bacterium]
MDIQTFKTKLFEAAKNAGFSDFEIYYVSSKSFSVTVFQNNVREYKNSSPVGLSFRGTYDGKVGYVYTENISEEVINFLIENAKQNAIIKEEKNEFLFEGSKSYPKVPDKSQFLDKKTSKEKIDMAKEMEKIALEIDKRIVSVDASVIANGTGLILISNSYGLDVSFEYGDAVAYVITRATDGTQTKIGYNLWSGADFSTFDAEKIAKKAVKITTDKLGASSIKSGTYDILIENKAAVQFLSAFVSNFYAEVVQKGFSLLKDKINKKIASSIITIKDNVMHPDSLTAVPFDSEGVATFDKIVIEKGILKTYLYDIKSAKKDNLKSTGNGFKSSFKSAVGIDVNNFFIEPSTKSIEEIKKDFSGILITSFAGMHSGVNSTSGDFSLQAGGFLIENGETIKPVEQIVSSGNFYDLLNNIEDIANDLYFNPMGKSIGSPTLLVKSITISGE